ncbi:hypothetical protein HMPREF9470_03063 [[Clostridium] citroniae WAL-19142]|uniref:Uncharacterized protein n=2 Tax=Enterocloster citroniae TaxID=358743 RepID=A0ABV2FU25_9FIRM|nr:hypothetical protein HMPREF9470_03063 [[Clostridium] citroniae WAL-19142]
MEGPENPDEKDGAAFSLLESLIYSSPQLSLRQLIEGSCRVLTRKQQPFLFVGVYNFLMIYIVFFGVIAIKHLQFVK